MKLPQWKTTGQIEARKQTAQLQSFIPQHSAPQQRFIPSMTAEQYASSKSSQIGAIVRGGRSIGAAYERVKDARETAELRMAEADWVNATSSVETSMTQQPHEIPVLDENGQPKINGVTGLPEVRRPWETAEKEFLDYSTKLEQELSERHLSSKKNKALFAQYAAKQRAAASSRIGKWAMGHEADRANAGFSRAIDEAKSHERVVALRQEALTKHADPVKIEAAAQKAHQRITYTAINDHLSSVALRLNTGDMGEGELGQHLEDAYKIWENVKHRLSSEQNRAILNNIVKLDKEFITTIQPRMQAENLVNDIVRFRKGNSMDKQEVMDKMTTVDLYETYGSDAVKIIDMIVEYDDEGVDTRTGRLKADQLLEDAMWDPEADQRTALSALRTLIANRELKLDTGLEYVGKVISAGVNGNKSEDHLAGRLFEAATTAVEESLPAAWAQMTPREQQRMAADAKSDLAVLRVKYQRAVRENPNADRIQIAKDLMLGVSVPTWVLNAEGKPATSILDADMVKTNDAYSRGTLQGVEQRDLSLWEEKVRQTQRIIQGVDR